MITTIALTDQTTPNDLREKSKFLCDDCGEEIPYVGLSIYAQATFKKLLCLKCIGKELK